MHIREFRIRSIVARNLFKLYSRGMPVDNTSLFRARAKTIQMRQVARIKKEGGDAAHETKPTALNPEPTDATVSSSANYSIYSSKANEIRRCLTELKDAVISRRREYITAVGHCNGFALSTYKGMSEWERNKMDDESERAMRQCSQLIRSLQRQIRLDTELRSSDEAAHLEEVARILDGYLKKIAKIITELRSVRVRKTATMNKITRLSTLVRIHESMARNTRETKCAECNGDEGKGEFDITQTNLSNSSSSFSHQSTSGIRRRHTNIQGSDNFEERRQPEAISSLEGYTLVEDHEEPRQAEIMEPLSDEESVQLMAENEKLYAKFAQVNSDVLRIEQQMNHIHRLQETFAEKVLDQERDIGFVNEAAVHTVENIRDGNEQIRQAIQNMASRRVILLFCIIVLTFTLLFLDWYNP
uniref:Syntaxin-18 n=1 Tax=Ascaris suum TaxID=6253 RepID=F1KYQ5_ASCSU